MARLRWGVKTAPQHTTYDAMLAVWRDADLTPAFEHAWLFDHFNPIQGSLDGPCFEGWTLLAALAAQTSRLRLGLMVAGNTYRHPAVHAHGGHGGRDLQRPPRFRRRRRLERIRAPEYGDPLYTPGERIRRLGEACEITKRLWIQQFTDFDGRYYQLNQARLEPKPIQKPYPPIVIGGSGEQLTLRVVARADIWNFTGSDVETFRHKVRVLHEHCAASAAIPSRSSCQCRCGSTTTISRRPWRRSSRSSPVAPPTSS